MENNGFLEDGELLLDDVSRTSSGKTNLILFGRNFVKIMEYLRRFRNYVEYLSTQIDSGGIIEEVITELQQSKTLINISSAIPINGFFEVDENGIIYRLTRTSDKTIEVSNRTIIPWNVEPLAITIKTFDGMIVYPTIITSQNKIEIHFNDELSINYIMIF